MKTLIKSLFITLFAVVICACSDDEEKDLILDSKVPWSFVFDVVNADGNDLVADGSVFDTYSSAKIVYGNEVYYLHTSQSEVDVESAKHIFAGGDYNGQKRLMFYLFTEHSNESFTIDWGDGKKDVIAFSSDANWVPTTVTLNGKPVELQSNPKDVVLRIVK